LEQQYDAIATAIREMIPLQRELEEASSESNAAGRVVVVVDLYFWIKIHV
jgi:hypothetical protein